MEGMDQSGPKPSDFSRGVREGPGLLVPDTLNGYPDSQRSASTRPKGQRQYPRQHHPLSGKAQEEIECLDPSPVTEHVGQIQAIT